MIVLWLATPLLVAIVLIAGIRRKCLHNPSGPSQVYSYQTLGPRAISRADVCFISCLFVSLSCYLALSLLFFTNQGQSPLLVALRSSMADSTPSPASTALESAVVYSSIGSHPPYLSSAHHMYPVPISRLVEVAENLTVLPSPPRPLSPTDAVWVYYLPDQGSSDRWVHYHPFYASLLRAAPCNVRFFLDDCHLSVENCVFHSNTAVWLNAHSDLMEVASLSITLNHSAVGGCVLIHNNDERGLDHQFSAAYSRFRHVSRAYYQPYSNLSHVHWHPLGLKDMIFPIERTKIDIQRHTASHPCGFQGFLNRGDRASMQAAIRNNAELSQWCSIQASSTTQLDYVRWLQTVTFCLAPAGNNDETYRFYECLEYGAIPVVVSSYAYLIPLRRYVPHPLPVMVLHSWNELHAVAAAVAAETESEGEGEGEE